MSYPVRPAIHLITEFGGEPKDWTLRELAEYHKKVIRNWEAMVGGTPTGKELGLITEQWQHAVEEVAKTQGIPAGFLGYVITELVRTEMAALEAANEAANTPL